MAAAGWTAYAIQNLLADRGEHPCPSKSTVLYWVDEKRAAKHRARSARSSHASKAATADFKLPGKNPTYRRAFIDRLAGEGVPPASIAKVHNVVFDTPVAAETVRRMLGRAA
jgi:hypothetical protein